TLKMLVDSKNASGGINGREIRLITYDDKSDQNEAVLAAKKLIESDKVVAVIGGTTSGNAMATLPLFEKAHIPYISLASSKQITFPDDGSPRHWIFKTAPGDDIVIKRLLSYMKGQGWKNVAWLNVDNAFGSSGHTEFKHYAPEYGVQAVLEETFEASVDDAKALLTRVKKANPDAVIVWGTAQESAVVIKNIAELNLGIPVLASHGIGTPSFIDLAGKAANGVVFPIGRIVVWKELPEDDPQKAVLAAYDEQYRAAFGSAPSTFGGHAWDAFHLLTKAIEDAGDDSEAIRDALEAQQRFVGVTGIFHYTPDDHTGLSAESMVIAEIVDGTFRLKER
ncbi:MAG: ABC transporter substrate-binding protein, partial [Candidatus Carbobacillus sp.]|nr:ABC transporter substrate-binding protein [Candidatus Carbobacillus sp.]